MREYRGKRIDNGEFSFGDLIQLLGKQGENEKGQARTFIVDNRFGACIDEKGNFVNTEAPFVNEVDPDTVGQYTELQDKNRRQIFEGDILLIRRPGRDEQTHYGDNIPLGSYTEPMEPVVTEEIVSVIFANGWFGYVQTADKPHYTVDDFEAIPLSWALNESTASNEDELKELFSGNWGPRIIEGWEDDKDYLFEMYKVSTIEELIKYVGVEVIGNRWDHPHLLGEDSK